MKKLVWRLGKLPTPGEVSLLVKDKIITQDEAKEILFKSEDETDIDVKSLESEIKFLRELVEKLSDGKMTKVVEVIKEVRIPYYQWPWYQPYVTWTNTVGVGVGSGTLTVLGSGTLGNNITTTSCSNFSDIKTF